MGTPLVKSIEQFIETEIDDEAVLMHLDSGDFFSLAGTGLAVWQLVDGQRDRDAIVAALAAEYGADSREVGDDVDRFVGELVDLGFLA